MSTNQAQLLMRSFVMSQFSYCPLIWMCHNRKINTQINKLYERTFRLVYSDKSSSFRKLLERDNSVTIHERNIEVLLTEIFKIKSGAAPEIMAEIFKFKDHSYDLRKINCLQRRILKSCKYGSETVSNLGPKLWNIPKNIKKAEILQEFKNKIKYWTPLNFLCKVHFSIFIHEATIFLIFLMFLRTTALRLLWDNYYLVDRYFNNLYS